MWFTILVGSVPATVSDVEQTQYTFQLWFVSLHVITHPFGIGWSVLISPPESVYEASMHLGWITIEITI